MTPTKDVSNRVVFKSPDTTTTTHNKSKNNNSTLEQILSTSVHAPPPEKKSESTVQRCSNDDDDDAKPSSSSSYNNTLNIWSVLLLLCSRVVIKSVREMVKITKSASSSIDVVFEASRYAILLLLFCCALFVGVVLFVSFGGPRRHITPRFRVDTIAFPFRFREARSIVSEICSDIIAAFSLSLERRKKKTVCCIGAGYVGGPTMAMIALKCPHIEVESVSSFSRVSSSSSSSSISLLAGFVSKGGVRSTARVAPFVRLFRRHHERGREKSETKDFHRPTRESKTTTKREKSFVEWVALSLSFARM